MGYTHYFEHTEISQEVWDKIVLDCKLVCKDQPIEDDLDGSEPKFTNTFITFNGVDYDGHETFDLNRKGSAGFTFCKTAAKPYDLAVTACLLIYKHHSPDTMILSSDGDDEDWVDAKKLVWDILGV